MDNKYSRLDIDITRIKGWINDWCNINNFENKISEPQNDIHRIRYDISINNKTVTIDFLKCKGGLLTIQPKVGKDQETSLKIADYILSQLSNKSENPYANGFTLKITSDDFETLIMLLKEQDNIELLDYSKQDTAGKPVYDLYHFKSHLKDTVAIKYFRNTNTFQMQGKPLYLFREIMGMISQTNDKNANNVLDQNIELFHIKVDPEELELELKSILGDNLYNFLAKKHRIMIKNSMIFSRSSMEGFEDYSFIPAMSLRAYEGMILRALNAAGIILQDKEKIGSCFYMDKSDEEYYLKQEYKNTISSNKTVSLERMYRFYRKNRHPMSHATATDFGTFTISSFEIAVDKVKEIIDNMKSNYLKYAE